MLMDLQQQMLAACYGDPDGFARALSFLRPASVPVDKALYVHTATVTAALTSVLAQAYPSLEATLGCEAFADAAKTHLRANPPAAAMLSAYGEGFGADFAGDLPTLATADWFAHIAYFAADATPLTGQALAVLPPDALASLRLPLVPSAQMVAGTLELLSGWQQGRGDVRVVEAPLPLLQNNAVILIWRGPDLLVAATLLPPDAGACVQALADGADLLSAAGFLTDPSHLPPLLALLLGHGLVAAAD